MPVDDFRLVQSMWEWLSLSNLSGSVYHEPAWTEQSTARIRRTARALIVSGYARIWSGDTLIGCPVIRVDTRWFNTPRTAPTVLSGTPVGDPTALFLTVARRQRDVPRPLTGIHKIAVLSDDHQLAEIAAIAASLEGVDYRRFRSMTSGEVAALGRTVPWESDDEWQSWIDVIGRLWRAGSWTMEMRCHSRDGEPVGWTVWVIRADRTEHCIAALRCDAAVPAWGTAR